MASGALLLTTGVGGANELVEDGQTGYLFEANSSESLELVIRQLLKKPNEIYRVASAGKAFAQAELSVVSSSKKLESIFESYSQSKSDI